MVAVPQWVTLSEGETSGVHSSFEILWDEAAPLLLPPWDVVGAIQRAQPSPLHLWLLFPAQQGR